MTIREMHIEVQQSLNQVAANRSRKLFPEEIDWVLNKQEKRFIQSCLVPKRIGNVSTGGFEIDQLKAEAIQSILVTGKALKAFVDSKANRYKCVLPPDYAYLISDASFTTPLCGAVPVLTQEQFIVHKIRQDLSAKAAAPFYVTETVVLGNTVAIPADLPYGHNYTGYPEKGDVDFLRAYIAHKGGWYWEQLDIIKAPKQYLSIVPVNTPLPTMTIDGTASPVGTTSNLFQVTHAPGTGHLVPNRLTPSQLIYNMGVNPYWKPSSNTPISELSGNYLYVYRDDSFTVNGCEITYVRKTRPLSLSLNTDSEIAPDFHQSICDLSVEYLKSRVENEKGTALAEGDLQKRVIL